MGDVKQLACWLSLFALAPIPWTLAEPVMPEADENAWKETWEDRRDRLVQLSLLQRVDTGVYQLHQLVREYLLAKLAQREDAEALKQAYCRVMVLQGQQIPQGSTRELWTALTPVMSHIAEAADSWQAQLSDEDLLWPFLAMARFYNGQGAYAQAEPWYAACLQTTKQRLGNDHPAVATSLNNLAGLYESQGRYGEAEPLYEEALALRRKLLGDDHPDVASSLNNLALLYNSQGRYGEAEPLYLQAIDILHDRLGDNHPTTNTVISNFYYFIEDVLAAGGQSELSDHPSTQKMVEIAQSESEESEP